MVRVAFLAFMAVAAMAALPESMPASKNFAGGIRKMKRDIQVPTKSFTKMRMLAPAKAGGSDVCSSCISLIGDGLNALINSLMSIVPATCGDLCSNAFPNSEAEAEVCSVVCDLAGLYEFINVIETADLSPIWACIEVDACPETTCKTNCVNVTRVVSNPASVAPPGVFHWSYVVTFNDGVGTSTTVAGIEDRGKDGWGCDQGAVFLAPQPHVPYSVSLQSHTEVSEGMGMPNLCPAPGTYSLEVDVCKGLCGDKFANSGPVIGTGKLAPVKVEPATVKCEHV